MIAPARAETQPTVTTTAPDAVLTEEPTADAPASATPGETAPEPRVGNDTRQSARQRHLADASASQQQFRLHAMLESRGPSEEPLPAPVEGEDRFVDRAIENFDAWDTDDNGHLSESEVAAAVNDSDNTGSDAAAAAALHHRQDEIEELSDDEWGDENDGVTLRDLAEYNSRLGTDDDTVRSTEFAYRDGQRRIRETSRDLFVGEASTEHMRQGRVGTCDLNAAAGSIAAQDHGDADRNRLEDMITDNGDGTYTVAFPDESVTVDAPTDAEIARYSTAGENGLWMTVLEKAYGELEGDTDVAGDAGDGALPGTAVSNLTDGSDVDFLSTTSLDTTRTKLRNAFDNHEAVTAHIHKDAPWGDSRRDGLPMGHAYSVVGYDEENDTVTLRNPWGRTEPVDADGNAADGTNDGVFTMSIEEFDSTFTNVAYGE
ncbi:MAG: C2 family cysteine protease [Deltaproteobacteria bacterium]|jgi:hypothetical protein